MLSQTKMQLWYPKQSCEEKVNNFLSSTEQNNDEKNNITPQRSTSFETEKSSENEIIDVDTVSEEDFTYISSKTTSSISALSSRFSEDSEKTVRDYSRIKTMPKKRLEQFNVGEISDFIDLDYWKMEKICCGAIFKGAYDEVLIDTSLIKPCTKRVTQIKKTNTF